MPDLPTIKVFSARACAAPLEQAAAIFTRHSGIAVEISVCSRHCASMEAEEATGAGGDDFLEEIADAGVHDLAVGGAEYLLDDGEVRGIVVRGQRQSIARSARPSWCLRTIPKASSGWKTWPARACEWPCRCWIASRGCGRTCAAGPG